MATLKPTSSPKISESDALEILEWLHGSSGLSDKDMTKVDCGYAEAILIELLDASFAIGFIEALFKAAMKAPSGPKKVIVAFLKGAGKNLVKYKDKGDLEKMMKEPVIYKAAFEQAKRSTKSAWAIRVQTGEW